MLHWSEGAAAAELVYLSDYCMDIDHADSSAIPSILLVNIAVFCFYDLNYLTETGRFVDKVILQNEILPNGYDFKI